MDIAKNRQTTSFKSNRNWPPFSLSISILTLIFFFTSSAIADTTTFPATGIYNGFIGQLNILECDNNNTSAINGTLNVFSQEGASIYSSPFLMEGNGSAHIILNHAASIDNSYGTYRVTLNSSSELNEKVSCRTLYYKSAPPGSEKEFEFAYAIPVQNSDQGQTSGIFNSFDPAGQSKSTFNWLSIVNTSKQPFNARIEVYDEDGNQTKVMRVNSLTNSGRTDLALGHDIGQARGLFKIIPDSSSSSYQAFVTRYGVHHAAGRFTFAFPIKSIAASCRGGKVHASTMGSAFTQNWLEIANTENSRQRVTANIYDRFGNLLQSIPLVILAGAQEHIYLNDIIDPAGTGNVGSIDISCTNPDAAILSQSIYYGAHSPFNIAWAYGVQSLTDEVAQDSEQLAFPLNTFLGMSNWIKLAEEGGNASVLDFALYDSQGDLRAFGEESLPAKGTIDFDVHSKVSENTIGSAVISSRTDTSISGHVLRILPENDGKIGSIVYIPGTIQGKNILFKGGSFTGNAQSLAPYRNALNDQEIEHFFTRVAFGSSLSERALAKRKGQSVVIDEMLAMPPNPSLDLYIQDPNDPDWNEVKVAWLRHMIESQNPLQERMALILHDLFATSCKAAGENYNCKRHVELLRSNALGNFKNLTKSITLDYVMLRWLNGDRNTAESPDENFSREFWELFTLGEASLHTGPYRLYDNSDITESSRAFTGWRTWFNGEPRTVGFDPRRHDGGVKRLWLGTPYEIEGNFGYEDIVNLTLDRRPESSEWIAKRLFSALVHDNPEPAVVQQLAAMLRQNNWDLKPVVRTLLKSEAFYSEESRNSRVKDSVTYLLGFFRTTKIPYKHSRFSWNFSHQYTGYEPTRPLSVKGWPLNKYQEAEQTTYFLSWLTGYANLLSTSLNDLVQEDIPYDVLNLIPQSRNQPTAIGVVYEVANLLGVSLSNEETLTLVDYVSTDRRWNGEEVALDLAEDPEALGTKVRGLIWLLSQHQDYLTF